MYNSTPRKPPVGLTPKAYAIFKGEDRRKEIAEAIARYLIDGKIKIPQEWIEEYNETLAE